MKDVCKQEIRLKMIVQKLKLKNQRKRRLIMF